MSTAPKPEGQKQRYGAMGSRGPRGLVKNIQHQRYVRTHGRMKWSSSSGGKTGQTGGCFRIRNQMDARGCACHHGPSGQSCVFLLAAGEADPKVESTMGFLA